MEAWHEQADKLEIERDTLAVELREMYAPFVEKIIDLFSGIDANTAAISDLHVRALLGEPRRLIGAELKARGQQSYSAAAPPLRENLKLPEWAESSRIAFPPPLSLNPYAAVMVSAARALEAKQAGLYSITGMRRGRSKKNKPEPRLRAVKKR